MLLRRDLKPDDFVRVDNAPNTQVPEHGIYQILTHRLEADADMMSGQSTLFAELVYDPAGMGLPLNSLGPNFGVIN